MVGCVAALSTGIWAAHAWNINLVFVVYVSVAVALFAATWYHGQAGWRRPVLAILWFTAGLLRMDCVTEPDRRGLAQYNGQVLEIQGRISDHPAVFRDAHAQQLIRYPVEVESVKLTSGRTITGKQLGGAFLTTQQTFCAALGVPGDEIQAVGKVRLIHSLHNPGQPDWSEILSGRGIAVRLTAAPGTLAINPSGDMLARLARWRNKLREEMTAAMPERDAALVMGMLFGGYAGIEQQDVRDFAATGVVHILSVSGAHVALVCAAVFWLARQAAVKPAAGAVIAGLAICAYGFISGFSPPVTRAVLMGLLALAAILTGRFFRAADALSLAVAGMLLWEPLSLFDISFQLSVACTAGLLYLHPPLYQEMKLCLPKQPKAWLIAMIGGTAATIAAQAAALPLLLWYFGMLPVLSLAANLLVVPVLEAVILLGLLAAILGGFLPGVAHVIFVAVSLLTGAAVEVNRFLAKAVDFNITLSAWNLEAAGLYYFFLGWAAGCWDMFLPPFGQTVRQHRRLTAMAAGLAVSVSLLHALQPQPLSVHFIDVGQGDATLILTPHGRSILVDAGGSSGGYDLGERVIVPYLRHYGVKRLDGLILTHNHEDHAGGAGSVTEMLPVRWVAAHRGSETSAAMLRLAKALKGKPPDNPDHIAPFMVDGVKFSLYKAGSEQDFVADSAATAATKENSRSTVIRIEYGNHSFLITGDLEGNSEKNLRKEGLAATTVLKVGHHGSSRSCQKEFLNHIAPLYAVISVGAANPYGHPAASTLNRLQELPATILRTDRNGAIVFQSDGTVMHYEKALN